MMYFNIPDNMQKMRDTNYSNSGAREELGRLMRYRSKMNHRVPESVNKQIEELKRQLEL